VLRNPFAGVDQGDLTELFEHGALLGAQLAAEAVAALGAPTVSYGKAAIVGALGLPSPVLHSCIPDWENPCALRSAVVRRSCPRQLSWVVLAAEWAFQQ
jgi:hypothetical protein